MKPMMESWRRYRILSEAAETITADINEIWFAFLAAGSSWDKIKDGGYAKKALDERIGEITNAFPPDEAQQIIDMQKGRAKKSLDEVKKWGDSNGYTGTISKAYWTARPGTLEQAVNDDKTGKKIDVVQGGAAGNPSDVVLRFGASDQLLGVSLKSTGGSGKITFKNGGFRSTIKSLGTYGVKTDYAQGAKLWEKSDWNEVVKQAKVEAASDLPMALTEADAKLKAQPQAVRKAYTQTLQYYGWDESERLPQLIKKYNNIETAKKKQADLEEWGKYLEAIIPSDQLGGKTFQEFAKSRYQELKDHGNRMLGKARDIMLHSMNQLSDEQRKAFILTDYINAKAQTPYWIKATGMGTKEPYSAAAEDPINNPSYLALSTLPITFESIASGTVGVKAGDQRIMKIRVKWESAPLTTSIKTETSKW